MTAPANGPSARLEALTGLRGLAAWYVVFYHLRLSLTDLLPAAVITALAHGYLAVDLFFMLSGFVMWLNYASRLERLDCGAIGRFWWRRFARIWPLHAVMLAGFVALAAAVALKGGNPSGYPLGELPLHLLLIQNWGFTSALAWNHPAWSISTEMAAYLLFPLLAWLGSRSLGVAALVLCMSVLHGALYGVFAAAGYASLGQGITSLGLVRCLIEFTIGTLAARLWLHGHSVPTAPAIASLCAAGAAVTLGTGLTLGLPETSWAPVFMVCVLLAVAFAQGGRAGQLASWLSAGPLHWLGEVSYSTYLCHFGLFVVFKLLFVDADLQLGAGQLAGFVALLVLVSSLSHAMIELPAQRALNALQPRLRSRVVAAS
jgi:peptidoglycan/LPS O-acetylase OafA/YrhL